MERKMKVLALFVALFVLVISGVLLFKELGTPVGCPEDLKICPDGTTLSRVPPSCVFPECPNGAGISNPASVYCETLGGTLEIMQEEPGPNGGGQVGMCSLPNGQVCEEWTLYRGECVGFSGANGTSVENPARISLCSLDSDCVPDGGCHPTSCINRQYRRNENGPSMCTAACLGPLDCGAGKCSCVEGLCEIVPS